MTRKVVVENLARRLLTGRDQGETMKLSRQDRRTISLALFGLMFGGLTIVTASECTGDHAASSAAGWLVPPPTAEALQVPGGADPTLHLRGRGSQIYSCSFQTAAAGGGPATSNYFWSLKGPDAQLFDATGAQVGVHTKGPTWSSSRDGSGVVGEKAGQADPPVGGAAPWLLLRGKSWTGAGVFSHVAFIQRVNTSGGVAPGGGCDATTVNSEVSVAYAADYFFYDGPSLEDGASK